MLLSVCHVRLVHSSERVFVRFPRRNDARATCCESGSRATAFFRPRASCTSKAKRSKQPKRSQRSFLLQHSGTVPSAGWKSCCTRRFALRQQETCERADACARRLRHMRTDPASAMLVYASAWRAPTTCCCRQRARLMAYTDSWPDVCVTQDRMLVLRAPGQCECDEWATHLQGKIFEMRSTDFASSIGDEDTRFWAETVKVATHVGAACAHVEVCKYYAPA